MHNLNKVKIALNPPVIFENVHPHSFATKFSSFVLQFCNGKNHGSGFLIAFFFNCRGQKLFISVLLYPFVTRLKITGFEKC